MTDNQRGRIDSEVKAQSAIKEKADADKQLSDLNSQMSLQKELVR